MSDSVIVLTLCGLLVSLYALRVEHMVFVEGRAGQAVCDISEQMSCSKVLGSRYAFGFGVVGHILGDDHPLNISNALVGLLFYSLVLAGTFTRDHLFHRLLFAAILLAGAVSVYLSVTMLAVLRDFCVVCSATHFINLALLCAHWKPLLAKRKRDH
eukprot:m.38669 g.38669  ORF g.38669 m.38669 type:complete len:156 (+) comp45319_c0_seq1:193-660(+)